MQCSWSTAAQKVSGALAQCIADNGGAIDVAAGSAFCVALTASGRVVVWGKVPGGAPASGRDGIDRGLMEVIDGVEMTMGEAVR